MADNSFGLKIGIEGEKEFKQALSDINAQFKVLGSEMKLATSQFDANEKSVESLTAKNAVLTKEIDAQKQKVETLKAALQNASESFGESDSRTLKWATSLNNAQAELNNMERELQNNTKAIDEISDGFDEAAEGMDEFADSTDDVAESADDASKSADDLGDNLDEAGDSADKSGGKFESLGGILKTVGGALATVAAAAGAAAIKLGKEVVEQFGELEQNLGGAEAVFGDYASELERIGEDAYKTMGTSQSEYLATANKMGALFQGSGVDQQRSLELTTQAMQRAADMASVMLRSPITREQFCTVLKRYHDMTQK